MMKYFAFILGITLHAISIPANAQQLAQSASAADQTVRARVANEDFERALIESPDKRFAVAAFFSSDIQIDRLRTTLSSLVLRVKAMRHGTAYYSGGYTLSEDETMDQAIENYKRDHQKFLRERILIEDQFALKESDSQIKIAYTTHRREAEHMLEDYELNGLRIVGVEIEGEAKEIESFRRGNSFVRVIEITRRGVPQPAIIPR